MGIRGLFSYIQNYVEGSLEWHKLHDCNLVIDGNNLAYDIFNNHSSINYAFGGDYDKYATLVEDLFRKLLQCNVKPYVIMDGGYPVTRDKFITVFKRMNQQIAPCLRINPDNQRSTKIFPIMGRAVFVNVIQKLGIDVLQCDFEADDEIAVIAKELDAYVLSNDSDFYLFGVPLIQLNSINLNAIQKETKRGKSYKFIPCYRFDVNTFAKITSVRSELLPLLAPILGNDYMNPRIMMSFYRYISYLRPVSSKISERHKLIMAIVKWLATQVGTPAEVLEEILNISKFSENKKTVVRAIFKMYFPSETNLKQWVQHHNPSCPSLKGIKNISAYASSAISRVNFKQKLFVPPKVKWELECTCQQRLETSILYGRTMPDWFVRAFRLHLIPPLIADIFNKNYLFLIPQIEMKQRPSIYIRMEPLLKVIRGILWLTLEHSLKIQKVPSIERPFESFELNSDPNQEKSFFLKHLKESSEIYDEEEEENDEQEESSEDETESGEENSTESSSEQEFNAAKSGDEDQVMEPMDKEEDDCDNLVSTQSDDKEDKMDISDDEFEDCVESMDKKIEVEAESEVMKDDSNKVIDTTESLNFKKFQKTKLIPSLKFYVRNGEDLLARELIAERIEKYHTLPSLFDVENLSLSEKKKAFFKMIGMKVEFEEEMPLNIEFILTCICYWRVTYKIHVDESSLLSVLMCVIMFCVVDGTTGRIRSKTKFGSVVGCVPKKVKTLLKNGEIREPSSMSVSALIQNLTLDEIRMANISMYQFHDLNPFENRKTYDRFAIHAFSEYQATIYFLQILNSLLCFPYPSISVESFWSGTFCYNIRKCFRTNIEVLDVLSTIFNGNLRIIDLFVKLYNALATQLELPELKEGIASLPKEEQIIMKNSQRKKLGIKSLNTLGITKKKTKKKKKPMRPKFRPNAEPAEPVEEWDVLEDPTEEELLLMSNNKFSSLLIK